MLLLAVGTFLAVLSLACAIPILIHAFRRSVGTGLMVLLIPCFIAFYAFVQFEHRRKGVLVATWIAAFVLAALCNAVATSSMIQQLNAAPLPVQ